MTSTKTAQRETNRRVRELRADRKRWLTGQNLHQGMPWCDGPTSPYHQEPACEGCGTVAYCRDRAAEVDQQIEALLNPPQPLATTVQGSLW